MRGGGGESTNLTPNIKATFQLDFATSTASYPHIFGLLFLLAIFATMIKIANFALILAVVICFLYAYRAHAFTKSMLKGYCLLAVISLVFVLPWVLKGYAHSGMIAYPSSIGYIPSLPFAVSEATRQNEVCWIMSWARDPAKNCVAVLSSHAWMLDWFLMKQRYFGNYFKYFVYAFIIGAVFVAVAVYYLRMRLQGFFVVFICICVGVVYWFFVGPDPRFGMVYIIPLLASILSYLLYHIYKHHSVLLAGGFMLAIVAMGLLWSNVLVFAWGVVLLSVREMSYKWLLRAFLVLSVLGVMWFYRHEWREIFIYPKVAPVYVESMLSDFGVLEYVRRDSPTPHTKEISYEARPMTPYFNPRLYKDKLFGRDMFGTHHTKEQE